MSDNDVKLLGNDEAKTPFFPESKDLGSSVRRPMFGVKDGANEALGSSSDDKTKTTTNGRLAAIAENTGAGAKDSTASAIKDAVGTVKSAIDTLRSVAATDAALGTLADKLSAALTFNLPANAATETSLSALVTAVGKVETAIKASIDLASSVWTDANGKFYFVLQRMNEATGVVTPTIVDASTNLVATPGAGFMPFVGSGSSGGGAQANYRIGEQAIYVATAGGTGYAKGEYLGSITIIDESTSPFTVVTGGWINLTQHTMLSSAPTSGTYDRGENIIPPLVQTAMDATATFQSTLVAAVGPLSETTAADADEGGFSLRRIAMRIAKTLTSIFGASRVFAPIPGQTVSALATNAATTTAIKLPTQALGTVDAYRVRLKANAAGPVFWTLSTDSSKKPVATVAYGADGTGGTPGDKAIDPGGVEIFRLTDAQQAALAGAGLYLAVLAPTSDANTILSITPGLGGN